MQKITIKITKRLKLMSKIANSLIVKNFMSAIIKKVAPLPETRVGANSGESIGTQTNAYYSLDYEQIYWRSALISGLVSYPIILGNTINDDKKYRRNFDILSSVFLNGTLAIIPAVTVGLISPVIIFSSPFWIPVYCMSKD